MDNPITRMDTYWDNFYRNKYYHVAYKNRYKCDNMFYDFSLHGNHVFIDYNNKYIAQNIKFNYDIKKNIYSNSHMLDYDSPMYEVEYYKKFAPSKNEYSEGQNKLYFCLAFDKEISYRYKQDFGIDISFKRIHCAIDTLLYDIECDNRFKLINKVKNPLQLHLKIVPIIHKVDLLNDFQDINNLNNICKSDINYNDMVNDDYTGIKSNKCIYYYVNFLIVQKDSPIYDTISSSSDDKYLNEIGYYEMFNLKNKDDTLKLRDELDTELDKDILYNKENNYYVYNAFLYKSIDNYIYNTNLITKYDKLLLYHKFNKLNLLSFENVIGDRSMRHIIRPEFYKYLLININNYNYGYVKYYNKLHYRNGRNYDYKYGIKKSYFKNHNKNEYRYNTYYDIFDKQLRDKYGTSDLLYKYQIIKTDIKYDLYYNMSLILSDMYNDKYLTGKRYLKFPSYNQDRNKHLTNCKDKYIFYGSDYVHFNGYANQEYYCEFNGNIRYDGNNINDVGTFGSKYIFELPENVKEVKTLISEDNILNFNNYKPYNYQLQNINWMYNIENNKCDITIPMYLYSFKNVKFEVDKKSYDFIKNICMFNLSYFNINIPYLKNKVMDINEIYGSNFIPYYKLIDVNMSLPLVYMSSHGLTNNVFNANNNGNKIYEEIHTFTMNQHQNIGHYSIKNNIDKYYYDDVNEEVNNKLNIQINGGILSDDVGLGKTYSMICHIIQNLDNDRNYYYNVKGMGGNIVILPNRLVSQWEEEIKKFLKPSVDVKVLTITTLTSLNKLAKSKKYYNNYDIVLVSNTLFNKVKYYEKFYKTDYSLESTSWLRIIIDEAHEVLRASINLFQLIPEIKDYSSDNNFKICYKNLSVDKKKKTIKQLPKNDVFLVSALLFKFKSRYRWCLTATPYMYKESNILMYLGWLSNIRDYIKFDVGDYIEDILLHSNEKNNKYTYMTILYNAYSVLLYNLFDVKSCYNFTNKMIRKNDKYLLRDKKEIDVPTISEEVIYVHQTKLEKDIYSSYVNIFKNRMDSVLIKICTNLLIINKYHISTDNPYNLDLNINNTELIDKMSSMSMNDVKNIFINELKKKLNSLSTRLDKYKTNISNSKILLPIVNKYIDIICNKLTHNDIITIINYYAKLHGLKNNSNAISFTNNKGLYNIVSDTNNKVYTYPLQQICEYIRNLYKDNNNDAIARINNKNVIEYYEYISNMILGFNKYSYFYNNTNTNSFPNDGYKILKNIVTSEKTRLKNSEDSLKEVTRDYESVKNQINIMDNEDYINDKIDHPCSICLCDFEEDTEIIIMKCKHIVCSECFYMLIGDKTKFKCPECRGELTLNDIYKSTANNINDSNNDNCVDDIEEDNELDEEALRKEKENEKIIQKYGSKMAKLVSYLNNLFSDKKKGNKAIIFSQYSEMLLLIHEVLNSRNINSVYCKSHANSIKKQMNKFKKDPDVNVILLSVDKANSGCNLIEANYVIFIDVICENKEKTIDIENQAIGRIVRLGQNRPVNVVRFITTNTIEMDYYNKNKYDITKVD